MTSLTRSALMRADASKCLRCRRMVSAARKEKTQISAVVRTTINFALSPLRRRCHAPASVRFVSVSGMLQGNLASRRSDRLCRMLFFLREDWQVLHGESKECEASSNDGARDGDLSPLRHVMHASCGLKTGDADIQAIGNESENDQHGGEIESARSSAYFLLK